MRFSRFISLLLIIHFAFLGDRGLAATRSVRILGLTPPCSLISCVMYRQRNRWIYVDSKPPLGTLGTNQYGSFGGVLVGAQGELLRFFVPRQTWQHGLGETKAEGRAWLDSRCAVHLGSETVTDDPSVRRLEIGGREEAEFIRVLREAAARGMKDPARSKREHAELAWRLSELLQAQRLKGAGFPSSLETP